MMSLASCVCARTRAVQLNTVLASEFNLKCHCEPAQCREHPTIMLLMNAARKTAQPDERSQQAWQAKLAEKQKQTRDGQAAAQQAKANNGARRGPVQPRQQHRRQLDGSTAWHGDADGTTSTPTTRRSAERKPREPVQFDWASSQSSRPIRGAGGRSGSSRQQQQQQADDAPVRGHFRRTGADMTEQDRGRWEAALQQQGDVNAARAQLRGTEVLYGVAPVLAALRAGRRTLCTIFLQVRAAP